MDEVGLAPSHRYDLFYIVDLSLVKVEDNLSCKQSMLKTRSKMATIIVNEGVENRYLSHYIQEIIKMVRFIF